MFKVGQEYYTKCGYKARVLCDDAGAKVGGKELNLVVLVGVPTTTVASGQQALLYSADGKYNGSGSATHDLVSNEPTEEELKLIAEVRCLVSDPDGRDADERMLKVIRSLRKK